MAEQIPALADSPALSWTGTAAGQVVLEAWYWLWPLGVLLLLSTAAFGWTERRGRQQAGLVLAGLTPWILLTAATTYRIFSGLPSSPTLERIEPLAILLYPIAIFVALLRFHLFDFRLVIRRSLAYSMLITALLLGFYGLIGGIGAFASSLVDDPTTSIWIVVGVSLVIGLAFGPLRRFLEALLEHRFFPERMDLRKRLGHLARELSTSGEGAGLGDKLVRELSRVFAVQAVTLLLAEDSADELKHRASSHKGAFGLASGHSVAKSDPLARAALEAAAPLVLADKPGSSSFAHRLEAAGVAVVQPLVVRGELLGLLLLGEKAGGEGFPSEEIELLDLFSSHVSAVLDNASLFESATIDGLTGLLRREAVLARLETEVARATRYDRPLSVALIDLDHFKRINDRHGHPVGDSVLQRIARTCSKSVRSADALGRYGGEELLLVLGETPLAGAARMCEGLRRKVEAQELETPTGETVQVTVSVGLASVEPWATADELSAQALLVAADRSLYAAKRSGRNRVVFPDPPAAPRRASVG